MADGTHISWTDATWPVTTGCQVASPGCDNCYAARLTSGRLAHLSAYAGLAEGGKFTGEVRLLPDRLDWPLRWTRPRRIFVASMSDLFHPGVPDDYIARVFAVMAMAPRHTFQVLTKRHARMRSLLNSDDFWLRVGGAGHAIALDRAGGQYRTAGNMMLTPDSSAAGHWRPVTPLPNVWIGVSVEDQHWADIRIPALLETPAAVRWLSCEPLLGPVDLRGGSADWLGPHGPECLCLGCFNVREGTAGRPVWWGQRPIAWVVAGGESGPGARPMHAEWARSLRDQCRSAGAAFHFKQWGEYCPTDQLHEDVWRDIDAAINLGGTPHPDPLRVGPRRAGRLLDGVVHDAYPEVTG